VPAVLERPHDLVTEIGGKPERVNVPGIGRLNLSLRDLPPGDGIDGRERVRALVDVHPDHDHACPFVADEAGSLLDISHLGRCHAPIRSRQRSSDGGGRHNKATSDQETVDKT
jgi:hypothetical protein